MQVALRPDRTVHAIGTGLAPSLHANAAGEMEEGTVEDITDETHAAIRAAMPDHGGGVTLSEDHATVTPNPETEASIQARAARKAEQTRRTASKAAILAWAENPNEIPVPADALRHLVEQTWPGV